MRFESMLRRGVVVVGVAGLACAAQAADPWADRIESYVEGTGASPGYTNPNTALGEPTRFTGVGVFPSAVTPFSSPYMQSEIVSIGVGGSLTVAFDEPVTNDPSNPFGIDLLIFGNSFFSDQNYPNGIAGPLFGGEGTIEVSADGFDWKTVIGVNADGVFPTLGYLDLTDPYAVNPGSILSDFTKPVDPNFNPMNATFAQLVAGYDGSGGGAGVDIGALGLGSIQFVRITNTGTKTVEIDAFSDVAAVPAPGSVLCVIAASGLCLRRRRPVGNDGKGRA